MSDQPRPTICLCMIVKDEIDVLEACIASCRDFLDYWVICDTGSTDGTQDLIRGELAGIPGELHERPWVDFGHNRTEVMELAHGKADYLLLLDADWVVTVSPDALAHLTADSYSVRFGSGVDFYRKTLVSGKIPWRFIGAIHEYIHSDEDHRSERLEGMSVEVTKIGGDAKGRWENDILVLQAELERDPENQRSAFYLAQTYRDLGHTSGDHERLQLALDWYRRRANMGGWVEEIYVAWYQAGVLSAELGDWPSAADALMRAWEVRPERLEATYALTVRLRQHGLHNAAHRYSSLAASMQPLPVPLDLLFVEPWVYKWGMLFEYSITSYWCGDYETAVAACKRLLAIKDLPAGHRTQTVRNMNYAVRAAVARSANEPPQVRKIMAAGTPTRGLRSHDRMTPVELRAPGLARRLAELCGMPVQTVDRRLLGLGTAVEVTVPRLADWPLHVRPGTSDVALLDLVCNGAAHLPPEELEDPALIVDLGASIGITALDLARRYPSAHIVAVEMDAASVALCAKNLEPLGDRATVVGAAIADQDGTVAYSTAGDPGHHFVTPGGEEHATAISLDTLFQHTADGQVVDYLKVNIQGSEDAVLSAGGRWPESVGAITVIVHPGYGVNDATHDLQKLGFMTTAGEQRHRVCAVRHDSRAWGDRPRRVLTRLRG
jgi:FkbM family methyltransferase